MMGQLNLTFVDIVAFSLLYKRLDVNQIYLMQQSEFIQVFAQEFSSFMG